MSSAPSSRTCNALRLLAIAKPTENLDAYDLYLRSLPHFYANTKTDLNSAVALLRRALEIDPNYARAKASLAHAYVTQDIQSWGAPGERRLALTLARETLAAGTDDPEALRCAGHAVCRWRRKSAHKRR